MNWYEQKTNEYESITGKQILREFGAEGYGVYIIIKQIIGQNMGEDPNEWGYVAKDETVATLAEKCGLSVDKFRLFLVFCNDRFILEKRNGRLFCPSILEEKNQYAKKVQRRVERTTQTQPPSTDSTDTTDKSAQYDVTTQHNTAQHINISKDILVKTFGDVHINSCLEKFGNQFGFKPVDKFPRRVAHNLIQRISKEIKLSGADLVSMSLDDRIEGILSAFFDWVAGQESLTSVKNLDTLRRNFDVFFSQEVKGKHGI